MPCVWGVDTLRYVIDEKNVTTDLENCLSKNIWNRDPAELSLRVSSQSLGPVNVLFIHKTEDFKEQRTFVLKPHH